MTKLNTPFFQLPMLNPRQTIHWKYHQWKKCLLWNFCSLASPLVPDRALMVVSIKKSPLFYSQNLPEC